MNAKDITFCAFGAAIIIVFSQITIPLAPLIPFTLQTFAIPLVSIILGKKRGFFACLIYVLLGIFGLPVFANFSGGFQKLIEPTAGFIISFPIMAYIIGYFSDKFENYFFIFLGVTIASIVNLFFGFIFFKFITENSFYQSFLICVVPFLLPTLLKNILSVYIGLLIKNRL